MKLNFGNHGEQLDNDTRYYSMSKILGISILTNANFSLFIKIKKALDISFNVTF